eukprot:CAMPEP_0194236776 /NCGR_PEP_ID=MMETSP0158-20130606/3958_1 /TAXON_ID=33649 /ORGANISM="Thalassionema nitzschioides, Strain L26-B" /LENGTH=450 /DNA_ID=CAMNT_0038970623 /DNA_START=593 /DNA_END=1945 /DNA_ORIENTATION=-
MAKISSRTRRKMDSKIWNMLGDRAKEMTTFHPIEISNTVWAFAKIRFQAPELFDHLANEAIARVDSFNSRDISNMLWSYATLGHYPSPKLFDAAAGAIIEKLDEFNSQDISNTLWSYATVGHPSPKLFDAAAGEAINKIDKFNSQDISTTLWSYATAGVESPELFDAASGKVINDIDTFNAQAISNTLWSYATFDHHQSSPNLFDAISDEAIKKMDTFNAQAISNTLWSYAAVGHPSSTELFDIALQQANKNLHAFTTQGLCNTLWSLAMVDHNIESAIPFLNRVLNLHQSSQLSLTIVCKIQLHAVIQWITIEHQKKSPIPDDLANKCLSAFIGNPSNPSQLEKEVVSVFRSLGFEVRDEGICKQTGYSIDAIVTTKSGNEIAVEVDGPTHFVGPVPTGARVLKRRQLDNLGETPLLSLPYWRWNELATTEEKQNYLEGEMKRILSETH